METLLLCYISVLFMLRLWYVQFCEVMLFESYFLCYASEQGDYNIFDIQTSSSEHCNCVLFVLPRNFILDAG